MLMYRSLQMRGDTIIEVLISIAVIGLVLGGAYATANRSSRELLDAQQHDVAVVLAESQLEQLDSATAAQLTTVNTSSPAACYNDTGTLSSTADYATDCVGYNKTTYPENFTIAITQLSAAAGVTKPLATYQVKITWAGLSATSDTVQMFFQPAGST
jgi:prepilin-type N-terminal cleavage/methylation domain-containing protein